MAEGPEGNPPSTVLSQPSHPRGDPLGPGGSPSSGRANPDDARAPAKQPAVVAPRPRPVGPAPARRRAGPAGADDPGRVGGRPRGGRGRPGAVPPDHLALPQRAGGGPAVVG